MLSPECKGIKEYLTGKYKCKDNDDLIEAALNEIFKLREELRKTELNKNERFNWYGRA